MKNLKKKTDKNPLSAFSVFYYKHTCLQKHFHRQVYVHVVTSIYTGIFPGQALKGRIESFCQ